MKVTLLAPFRVPFNLNRGLSLRGIEFWRARFALWRELLRQEHPDWALGKYGSDDTSGPVYIGMKDLGAGLRELYVLKLTLTEHSPNFLKWQRRFTDLNSRNLADLKSDLMRACPHIAPKIAELSPAIVRCLKIAEAMGEVRIIDNNIALLCLEFPVDLDQFRKLPASERVAVDEITTALALTLIKSLWPNDIKIAIEWLRTSLTNAVLQSEGQRLLSRLFGKKVAVQPLLTQEGLSVFDLAHTSSALTDEYWQQVEHVLVAWVSHVYSFTAAELAGELLTTERDLLIGLGVFKDDIDKFITGSDVYGWGPKLRRERPEAERIWLEALFISQFHYYSLDLIDRRIPALIAEVNDEDVGGSSRKALSTGRHIVQEVQTAIYDFLDMRARISSEARGIVEQLVRAWDVEPLLDNIWRKLDNLRETIARVSDNIDKRSSSAIELTLSLITVLSLITLPLTIYEALKPTDQPFIFRVLTFLQGVHRDFVFLLSIFTTLVAFSLIFYFRSKGRR